MSRPYEEQLSALIDDELPRDELALLVRRGATDKALGRALGRYALIREAMLRNAPSQVDGAFADRVAAAIEREPGFTGTRPAKVSRLQQRLLSPVAGVAFAASVAALAVLVWPNLRAPDPAVAPAMTSAPPAPLSTDFGAPSIPVDLRLPQRWEGGRSDGLMIIGGRTLPMAPELVDGVQWDRLDPQVQERLQQSALDSEAAEAPGDWLLTPPNLRLTGQDAGRP